MMTHFTDEHIRVAAILHVQWERVMREDPNVMLSRTRVAREAISSILIDLAVMYRENDPEFDFPRFLRESRQGAQ